MKSSSLLTKQAEKAYETYVGSCGQSRYLFGASYMSWGCLCAQEVRAWKAVVKSIVTHCYPDIGCSSKMAGKKQKIPYNRHEADLDSDPD